MKYVPKRLVETRDASRGLDDRPLAARVGRAALWVAAIGAGAYLLVGLLADLFAATLGESLEASLFAASVVPASPEDAAPPEMERARALFERLAERPGLRPLPYRLFFLDLEAPNAVALPGGAVGVTRGLLERVRGEVGLAAVLGHELGHHQARHTLERMGRLILWNAALSLIDGGATNVVSAGLALAESSHSRDQEREADRIGLRLVHETFGTTEGALELFELILREEGEGSTWSAFARSHPPTRERIETLRKLAEELEAGG